jgi:hypothetical protein
MNATKKAPEAELQRADLLQNLSTKTNGKDKQFIFKSPIRQRLYLLFLTGGKYSVVQLVVAFRIPDPRSHIRYIRDAGIPISDYWVNTENSRYKVYFLSKIGG